MMKWKKTFLFQLLFPITTKTISIPNYDIFQMVPTVSASGLRQTGGIPVELDEVEARNEEYPMTLAFLRLLNHLTDVPVPAALGAGYRVPGFDPYLDFLKDSVLLKFNTRAYKDAAQRVGTPAWFVSL